MLSPPTGPPTRPLRPFRQRHAGERQSMETSPVEQCLQLENRTEKQEKKATRTMNQTLIFLCLALIITNNIIHGAKATKIKKKQKKHEFGEMRKITRKQVKYFNPFHI